MILPFQGAMNNCTYTPRALPWAMRNLTFQAKCFLNSIEPFERPKGLEPLRSSIEPFEPPEGQFISAKRLSPLRPHRVVQEILIRQADSIFQLRLVRPAEGCRLRHVE